MPCWKESKGWRYRFQFKGELYRNTKDRKQPAFYRTKQEARAAEEAHKAELKKAQKDKTPTATGCKEAMNAYLDVSQRQFSEKNYKEKIFIYKSFLDHLGDQELTSITSLNITDYLKTRPTNENWNKHRKSLHAFFEWAHRKAHFIPFNPCLDAPRMPEKPKRKKIPSQEEMVRILLASGEHRPFFLCLYALAARRNEINNLRWEDVNFEKRVVILWTKKGKTGEWREQPKAMNQEVYDILMGLYSKRSGEWVFPNPETGEPYKNRRAQIRRACLDAGVPYYSWHCIRHHVASLLTDTYKQSLPTVQKMLGHQKLTTTERYVQSLTEGQREAADLLKVGWNQEQNQAIPVHNK